MSEPTKERPVVHLLIPLSYDLTGCCKKPIKDLPNDGTHLVTNRPIDKTCDGTGKVRTDA